jgi:hypothetical protein
MTRGTRSGAERAGPASQCRGPLFGRDLKERSRVLYRSFVWGGAGKQRPDAPPDAGETPSTCLSQMEGHIAGSFHPTHNPANAYGDEGTVGHIHGDHPRPKRTDQADAQPNAGLFCSRRIMTDGSLQRKRSSHLYTCCDHSALNK